VSTTSPIRLEVRDRAHLLRLDRGANALDGAVIGALSEILAGLERQGSPALVLASAHPKIFCPGLDLKKLDGSTRDDLRLVMEQFNDVLRRLATYRGPTVAAISGHAIGGGCLLALACDRRVMARAHARIGLSEINLGIPVPAGAVAMLLALYSTRSVEQLVLEGDGFGGERAVELGLVERLADGEAVVDEACALANHLARRPAGAFSTAKTYLRQALGGLMERRDAAELDAFLDHWFEAGTQDRIGALVAAMNRR
jgi:enoyl-CoA hydratase/carnithine racemase